METRDERVAHTLAWDENPSTGDNQKSILKGQQFVWSQSNAKDNRTNTNQQGRESAALQGLEYPEEFSGRHLYRSRFLLGHIDKKLLSTINKNAN